MNFFIYRMEWCKIFCEEDNKTHTVSSRALEPEDSEVLRCSDLRARKGLCCCGRLMENVILLHCLKFTARIETCSQKFIRNRYTYAYYYVQIELKLVSTVFAWIVRPPLLTRAASPAQTARCWWLLINNRTVPHAFSAYAITTCKKKKMFAETHSNRKYLEEDETWWVDLV